MWYTVLLIVMTGVMTIIGTSVLGYNHQSLSLWALAIPALWLLPTGGIRGFIFLLSLGLFGMHLMDQPLALSISVLMLFPVLAVSFSERGTWQVGVLLMCIVAAMNLGLMALQSDGKLSGSPFDTLWQMAAVVLMWGCMRYWKPIEGHLPWILCLALPMSLAGMGAQVIVGLSVVAIMIMMQDLMGRKQEDWMLRLAWILPTLAFATIVLSPNVEVHSSILVSWFLILGGGQLGEFLLDETEEEV